MQMKVYRHSPDEVPAWAEHRICTCNDYPKEHIHIMRSGVCQTFTYDRHQKCNPDYTSNLGKRLLCSCICHLDSMDARVPHKPRLPRKRR